MSKDSVLMDIVSPRMSEKAARMNKQRMKMKKIIETKHIIDHSSLIKAFEVHNPAKKVRESFAIN
jgi:hypothetical protein